LSQPLYRAAACNSNRVRSSIRKPVGVLVGCRATGPRRPAVPGRDVGMATSGTLETLKLCFHVFTADGHGCRGDQEARVGRRRGRTAVLRRVAVLGAVARVQIPQDIDDGRPEAQLVGCLVAGAPSSVVREASLLAAYAPRAVLVDQGQDLTGLLVDAAVFDQGVVVVGPGGAQVLATAGPG
jgi:hypothetical protein